MQYFMIIGADGRILSVASTGFHCGEGETLVDVPEGFTLAEALDWRMVDGALLYDPLPVAEVIPAPSLQAQIDVLSEAVLAMALGGGGNV